MVPVDPIVGKECRVHPSHPSRDPQTSTLSIADNAVAFYGLSGATWFFSATEDPRSVFDPSHIRSSLEAVLDLYPHFCGYLSLPPFDREKAKTHYNDRYGRLRLTWGGIDEPGVHLDFRQDGRAMSTIMSHSESGDDFVRVSGVDSDIVPPASRHVNPRKPPDNPKDKVCLAIRATSFACGGHSISATFHHAFADAQHLSSFMRDWAAIHTAMLDGLPLPIRPEDRPFLPGLLDQAAGGDLNAAEEGAELKAQAQSLPMLRLDWWASSKGKPRFMSTATEPPLEVVDQVQGYGRRIPWENVDWGATVLDRVLIFSSAEIAAIQRQILTANRDGQTNRPKVSKLDCLLTFVWRLLTQARLAEGSLQGSDELSIDVTVGLRSRTSPPLPYTFGGSPIVSLSATGAASGISGGDAMDIAASIRRAITSLTPAKTSALLHHMAFAVDPVREWNCFLGEKNLMVTSWLDSGMYEVDFGFGRAAEVRSVMPAIDGVICIVEVPPTGSHSLRWPENGVGVRVFAKEAVMTRVIDLLDSSRKELSV